MPSSPMSEILTTAFEPPTLTEHLAGKTIAHVEKDGDTMTIVLTNGMEVVIAWANGSGHVKGEPFIKQINASVRLSL